MDCAVVFSDVILACEYICLITLLEGEACDAFERKEPSVACINIYIHIMKTMTGGHLRCPQITPAGSSLIIRTKDV